MPTTPFLKGINNFMDFGLKLKEPKTKNGNQSFVPPSDYGNSVNVVTESNRYGNSFLDDASTSNTKKLIETYRTMASNSDVVGAIDEIVNAAVVTDDNTTPVEVVLDDVDLTKNIKDKISEEFGTILSLLHFNDDGDDQFRKWYIDGRTYYHIIVNKTNKSGKDGIDELREIDPWKIKKIREVTKEKNSSGVEIITGITEYYLYEDDSLLKTDNALKIDKDSIVCVTSGLKDIKGKEIVSFLHPAIKPFNQLVALEDSVVIYRVARAPERRIFYVDTGNLPPARADQYMRKMINAHQNKMIYDSQTGTLKENKHILSMMEDLWIPRREGSTGTSVDTLPGGQNLGEMDDVLYFLKKMYKALRIPSTRLDTENSVFQTGMATEISRDELKFSSYVNKLRKKFSQVFKQTLKTQLILKKVITPEDWEKTISEKIRFRFNNDSQFVEAKNNEIMSRRLDLLNTVDQFVGKYFSIETVRKEVLNQSEEDFKQEDEKMKAEKEAGLYNEGDQ